MPRKKPSRRRKPTVKKIVRNIGGRAAKKSATKSQSSNFALNGARKPKAPILSPLWTLEEGVTQSLLNVWQECQEQAGLKYIDGYTSKAISIPLEFGSVMHYGIQHQGKFSSPQETIRQITNQYRLWRSKSLLNAKERDTLEFLCGLAEVTFPAYCEYWQHDDKQIHWIGREVQFSVPYTVETPEGPREIILRGMRDGVFRLPAATKKVMQGALGVFETKNKSRISEREIIDGLRADSQTLFYCLATYLEYGEYPTNVKYNIIRRTDQSAKYRRQGESLVDYFKRVREDIATRPDFYFSRFKVDLSERDITDFQTYTLNPLLVRFIHWWDNVKKNPNGKGRFDSPYHSLNLNALTGKYGKADMWEMIVNRNTHPYRIRKEVFPELADSFQVT